MSIHIFSFVADIFVEIIISICNDKHFEGNWHKERFLIVLMFFFEHVLFAKVIVHFIHVHSFFQTIDPTRYRLSALQRFTTETGRLFFRTRSKQLPLARKENVLGHVEKRVWAHSFALCSSVFPSRFFSVVALWLFVVSTTKKEHDKDKGYRPYFSHG